MIFKVDWEFMEQPQPKCDKRTGNLLEELWS